MKAPTSANGPCHRIRGNASDLDFSRNSLRKRLRKSELERPWFVACAVATLLVLNLWSHPASAAQSQHPELRNLFHLAGIPGLRRDQRVNLALNPVAFVFETAKVHYEVPYSRVHQALLLPADRRYEGRTYAAALATYGVGTLFILNSITSTRSLSIT